MYEGIHPLARLTEGKYNLEVFYNCSDHMRAFGIFIFALMVEKD
jgi:hypothetical protein